MTAALARSETERDALAAVARERSGWSPLLAVKCGAVLATLEWIAGRRRLAPASGAPRVADDAGMRAEELAALDAETLARHALGDGTWAGTVGHTLAWCRHDPDTESPLL